MKKEISLKMWLSVFFRGIWQFIRNLFSWKNKGYIGKFVGVCFGLLALFICAAIAYTVYEDIKRDNRWLSREDVSNRIQFVRKCYSEDPGWISPRLSNEKLIENVEWVVTPEKEDSLAVFSQNGKRGYFNRYTGREIIPAKYDAAWVFSNGMAAVAEGDSIRFINEKGQPAINKVFTRDYRLNHVFHGDYCVMGDGNGTIGLIDTNGNWVVKPEYDEIIPAPHNYWKMRKGKDGEGLWYALTDKAEPVNMDGVRVLEINDDLGVIYTLPNHLKMVVDFEGNRNEKFLCLHIEEMYYTTDNRDKDGNLVEERTTLYRYRMSDGYEGLCKANGDIVTEPLYWIIKPIGKDLYHCTYKDTESGVIINSNGDISKTPTLTFDM